jgi:hypothetical protein
VRWINRPVKVSEKSLFVGSALLLALKCELFSKLHLLCKTRQMLYRN